MVTQRTDNPWPELHGSQNYRWDKSCVNIWNKVRTQRDRFLLVWVPRRTVRRKTKKEVIAFVMVQMAPPIKTTSIIIIVLKPVNPKGKQP